MGGCSVILMMLLSIPIFIGGLVIFFGIMGISFVGMVVSAVLFIVMTKKGVFDKYLASETEWQKTTAIVGKIALIVIFIISTIGFLGTTGILVCIKLST